MLFDRTHREFFWLLVRRDLKVRYAGSTLGSLWNLIHPLIMIAIYMAIFSSLMGQARAQASGASTGFVDYGTLTYGVHLCAGLLPWLVFSDVLMRSTGTLVENASFLKKVSFPPIVLFTSALFNALLIYGTGFVGFVALLWAMGKAVPLAALGGLVLMALLGILAMGLGLIFAGLNVFIRDTAQVISILLQLLFWFNPIVYYKSLILGAGASGAAPALLERAGRVLFVLNPFERFITATQSLFGLAEASMAPMDWAIVLLSPPLALAVGVYAFRRMLPDARDCL